MAEKNLRHHVVAAARDLMVISAALSALFGIGAYLTRAYWEPFAELPQRMAALQIELQEVQAALNAGFEPRIIDFQSGLVVTDGPVAPGSTIQILYSLRRNVSCDTTVTPIFYNVDRGVSIPGEQFPALKSTVAQQYQPFSVSIRLPASLSPGRYVYYPMISPVECGVYGEMRVPMSDIFEVISARPK